MARREVPVRPGPFEGFAKDLRALRAATGMTYREMARRAAYSASALSAAASGATLPSLEVTLAYVQACGGDVEAWRTRWQRLAADPEVEIGANADPERPMLAAEEPVSEPEPVEGERPLSRVRGTRARLAAIPLALAVVIGGVTMVLLGHGGGGRAHVAGSGTGIGETHAPGGDWTAFSGPSCASAKQVAPLDVYNDSQAREPWRHPRSGGSAVFPGCGRPWYSDQSGFAGSWDNDADWVFRPGARFTQCRFGIYVPAGMWADSVLYEVYPGDASNGYSGNAVASFTINQASRDAGGWLVSPTVKFSTGVVDLNITDAGTSRGAAVVADIVRALCL